MNGEQYTAMSIMNQLIFHKQFCSGIVKDINAITMTMEAIELCTSNRTLEDFEFN